MFVQKNKSLILILIIISFALVFAFVVEHVMDHEPCKLCIYQRIPYILSIFLIVKIIFFKKNEKMTLLILSILFVVSTSLAFYHFGIEQGFFSESLACETNNLSEATTKDEVLKQLNKNIISCKDVSFKILGFSLASINTVFSLLLSGIFLKLFLNYEKN